MMADFGETSC